MKKNIRWLLPLIICIVASIASVFLPILSYTYESGAYYDSTAKFNIIDFIEPSEEFVDIMATYSGSWRVYIDEVWLTILSVTAVLAIIAALAGVITMSRQRPNTWQFIMALAGIIGTAIPSLLVFLAVILSKNYFPGRFSFGVYPIITPIAMILRLIAVTQKHKKTQAEIQAEEKAKGLIRRAGDL